MKNYLLPLILLLFSCGTDHSILVFIDDPLVLPVIDYYNSLNNEVILKTTLENISDADIVISKDLYTTETSKKYESMDHSRFGIIGNKEHFYPEIYRIIQKEEFKVIPLNFDVPLVLFNSKTSALNRPKALSLEEFKTLGYQFNRKQRDHYIKQGFNPYWQPEWIPYLSRFKGLKVKNYNNFIQYDPQNLLEISDFFTQWSYQDDNSFTEDVFFQEKYLIEHPFQLLRKGRIGYYLMPASTFFSIHPKDREDIHFFYLQKEGKIFGSTPTMALSITSKGIQKGGTEDFISWLLNPEDQISLIQIMHQDNRKEFGFLSGFSTLASCNEYIGTIHKDLTNRLPRIEEVSLFSSLPYPYTPFSEEAYTPWLIKKIKREDTKELSVIIKEWLMTNPVE